MVKMWIVDWIDKGYVKIRGPWGTKRWPSFKSLEQEHKRFNGLSGTGGNEELNEKERKKSSSEYW
jgi:hypothetical protein